MEKHKDDHVDFPDVILIDSYITNFNGWECLDKIQQTSPTLAKSIKIYILSSFIDPEDIQRAKQYDCVKSFIFRPITKEILEKLINEETRDIL